MGQKKAWFIFLGIVLLFGILFLGNSDVKNENNVIDNSLTKSEQKIEEESQQHNNIVIENETNTSVNTENTILNSSSSNNTVSISSNNVSEKSSNVKNEETIVDAENTTEKSSKSTNTSKTTSSSSNNTSNSNNSRTVYKTPTGKRYHFDPDCGGKNSTATTMSEAKSLGLTPCKKCAQ